jgi:hypothetical protein
MPSSAKNVRHLLVERAQNCHISLHISAIFRHILPNFTIFLSYLQNMAEIWQKYGENIEKNMAIFLGPFPQISVCYLLLKMWMVK